MQYKVVGGRALRHADTLTVSRVSGSSPDPVQPALMKRRKSRRVK